MIERDFSRGDVRSQKIAEEMVRGAETETVEKGAKDIQSKVVLGNPASKIIFRLARGSVGPGVMGFQ